MFPPKKPLKCRAVHHNVGTRPFFMPRDCAQEPKIPKIQANFQWAWRKTAIVLAAIRSYQTVTNEPSASSTVDG